MMEPLNHRILAYMYQNESKYIGTGTLGEGTTNPVYFTRYGVRNFTLKELKEKANLREDYGVIADALELLESNKQIEISYSEHAQNLKLLPKGGIDYKSRFYITEQVKKRNEAIYDRVKWIAPIISIAITVIAIIVTTNSNRRISAMEQRICTLESKK